MKDITKERKDNILQIVSLSDLALSGIKKCIADTIVLNIHKAKASLPQVDSVVSNKLFGRTRSRIDANDAETQNIRVMIR